MEVALSSLRVRNFKCFSDITLPLSPGPKILSGRSGAGKTSALWSILVFLRAHNTRFVQQRNPHDGVASPLAFDDLALLLGDPFFSGPKSWQTLMRQQDGAGLTCSLAGTFSDGKVVEISFTDKTGALALDPTDWQPAAKIRYAFVQGKYHFGHLSQELAWNTGELNTGAQRLRSVLFSQAEADVKVTLDLIQDRLRDLSFDVLLIPNFDTKTIMVVEESCGVRLDIASCGSSLQKLVAIFVLFAALNTASDQQRVFLIDYPEAHLDEPVFAKFFPMLKRACQDSGIHLVVASSSSIVVDHVGSDHVGSDHVVILSRY